MGDSNGIVYERGSSNDRERAIQTARWLVKESKGGTAELTTWVWDQEEDKRIAGFRINARTEEVERVRAGRKP